MSDTHLVVPGLTEDYEWFYFAGGQFRENLYISIKRTKTKETILQDTVHYPFTLDEVNDALYAMKEEFVGITMAERIAKVWDEGEPAYGTATSDNLVNRDDMR